MARAISCGVVRHCNQVRAGDTPSQEETNVGLQRDIRVTYRIFARGAASDLDKARSPVDDAFHERSSAPASTTSVNISWVTGAIARASSSRTR